MDISEHEIGFLADELETVEGLDADTARRLAEHEIAGVLAFGDGWDAACCAQLDGVKRQLLYRLDDWITRTAAANSRADAATDDREPSA